MPKALISVYEKPGVDIFARALVEMGWEILSSGGTAKFLREADIPVCDVAELVGGGAILGHRVVTLSREIHAGLLARYIPEDIKEMESLDLPFIDLVCVDMYPLEDEITNPDSTPVSVLEKTDIGGPGMLRSAAKGRRIVICDPSDRQSVIDWLKAGKPDEDSFVTALAAKAEGVVAEYALASARYTSDGKIDGAVGTQAAECRYGENAWQVPARLFTTGTDDPLSLDKFQLIAGAPPSYNNYCDIDRLLQTISHIAAGLDVNGLSKECSMLAVGCKHGNPCGASIMNNPELAVTMMLEGDLRAIMGGLVMLNFPVDEGIADLLLTHAMDGGKRRLLDGVIAPSFEDGAVEMLRRKGDKCRFLANPALLDLDRNSLDTAQRFRYVRGGFLGQPNYTYVMTLPEEAMDESVETRSDLCLAWAVGATSNSNTITLVKDRMLIGNGVGQQDRVGGCKLAIMRARDAGHDPWGSVAYSDSFFPFADGPEALIAPGVRAVLATSGSVNDDIVRARFERAGVAFYTVPDAEGRGFFGH